MALKREEYAKQEMDMDRMDITTLLISDTAQPELGPIISGKLKLRRQCCQARIQCAEEFKSYY